MKKHFSHTIFPKVFAALGIAFALLAGSGVHAQLMEYIENKGQWPGEALYRGRLNDGAIFLTRNGYRVMQYHPDDLRKASARMSGHTHTLKEDANKQLLMAATATDTAMFPQVRGHAYAVRFAGASLHPQVMPERKMPGFSNFFLGNDPARWAGGVHSYEVVFLKEVYKGVDVAVFKGNILGCRFVRFTIKK